MSRNVSIEWVMKQLEEGKKISYEMRDGAIEYKIKEKKIRPIVIVTIFNKGLLKRTREGHVMKGELRKA